MSSDEGVKCEINWTGFCLGTKPIEYYCWEK